MPFSGQTLIWMAVFISVTKSWNRKNGLGPTKSCMNRVVPIAKVLKEFLLSLKNEYTSPTDPVLERLQDWTEGKASVRFLGPFVQ